VDEAVAAVHQEVVVVVDVVAEAVEALAAAPEEAGVVPGVAPTSSSNPIATLVSSSRKEKTICWSPKTLSLASLCMAKNGYLWKVVSRERRLNTECGILSGASSLPASWVVSTISTSSQVQKFCTWVLLVELASAMSPISLDLYVVFLSHEKTEAEFDSRKELFMPSNSPLDLAVT
jgi:hypothetical protein